MFFKIKERWYFSVVGWGAFVVGTILNLVFGPDLYSILAFLTVAVILTVANIVYVFYKKKIENKNILSEF